MNHALVLISVFGLGAAFSLGFVWGAFDMLNVIRNRRSPIIRWHEVGLYGTLTFIACLFMVLGALFAFFLH